MSAVNGVGEPGAGEPHARFDAAGTGNEANLATAIGVAQPFGKPAAQRPRRLPSGNATAPVPDPTTTPLGRIGHLRMIATSAP
jgi:hypothetical protein